jgi:hypothetical protein
MESGTVLQKSLGWFILRQTSKRTMELSEVSSFPNNWEYIGKIIVVAGLTFLKNNATLGT